MFPTITKHKTVIAKKQNVLTCNSKLGKAVNHNLNFNEILFRFVKKVSFHYLLNMYKARKILNEGHLELS